MTRASGSEPSKEADARPDPGHLLTDQLRLMAARFPDEVALVDLAGDRELTFAAWDEASDRVAAALVEAGLDKGDRVAVFLPMEESLEWVAAYAGIHKAAAVAVPTNTRLAARELEYVLAHSGAVAAFAGSATTGTLAQVRAAVPSLRWV